MWHSLSLYLSLSHTVCVRVFFFCNTSVKIGCFGLAPLASVNSVYLGLWCVFRCLMKLLVLNKVLSFPPLDTVAVQILHCALLLAAKFSETCILKYFDTMTHFPNTVNHEASATQDKTSRQISYL